MTRAPELVLASTSAIRAAILAQAGIAFRAARPDIDEEALKRAAAAAGLTLDATAQRLARAKALAVAAPGALVLGADQILEFNGRAFDKPTCRAEARARLLELQGAAHTLINAVAIARDGAIVFSHLDRPRLLMRAMSAEEIDRYLDRAGEAPLASVGAYQLEGLGANLFEAIDGDYFAVLGLALLPTLAFLRRQGVRAF